MTSFEKIEFFIENTKNISELRNLAVEMLHNYKVNFDEVYFDHKEVVDKCVEKDIIS